MIKSKITHEEFMSFVRELESEYLSKEKDYGWKYKVFTEEIDDNSYYYFTNHFQTSKIMYIRPAKILSVTTIYSKDLEIISKLKEGLL